MAPSKKAGNTTAKTGGKTNQTTASSTGYTAGGKGKQVFAGSSGHTTGGNAKQTVEKKSRTTTAGNVKTATARNATQSAGATHVGEGKAGAAAARASVARTGGPKSGRKKSPVDVPYGQFKWHHRDTREQKQTRHAEELAAAVRALFEARRAERSALELQWQLNLNFLLGNQYCDMDLRTHRVVDIEKQYEWSQREVFNHIAPIIEARLAKLGQVRPGMNVLPASDDSDDLAASRVCNMLLKAAGNKLNLGQCIRNAVHWSEVCGSVFYKTVWNSAAGRQVGALDGQSVREGELDFTVCPPFEIFPDRMDAEDVQNCRSVLHARLVGADEILAQYGVAVSPHKTDVLAPGARLMLGGWGYSAHAATVLPHTREDGVLLLELYERPTTEHPKGRLVVVAGDTLLHEGSLPYHVDEDGAPGLPFVRQVALQSPGSFFGVSIIERCIPLQRAYNAVKNRKHEYLNRLAMGVLAVEDGAVDCDQLEQEGLSPGRVLVYRAGGAPPVVLHNGNVPPEFTYEEDRLRSEFMTISGVSDMARYGAAGAGITSGVALEILREQDDSRLSMTTESIRRAIELVSQQWLRLYRQYVHSARLDRLAGENGRVFLLDWKASDLASDDVVCDSANETMQSLAQRRQMVMDMLNMGLLHNPDTGKIDSVTRRRVLEMLEFGRWEGADGLQTLHAARAEQENRLAQTRGIAPVLDTLDDHAQHETEHTRCYLTLLNNASSKGERDCMSLLHGHILEHRAAIQAMSAASAGPMVDASAGPIGAAKLD